jgi:hypothetical protein
MISNMEEKKDIVERGDNLKKINKYGKKKGFGLIRFGNYE